MQTLTKATFDINGMFGPLDGIHDPAQRWNGFAVPYLTAESVGVIQEVTSVQNATDTEDGYTITRDGHGVWFLDNAYADEATDVRGELVPTVDVDGLTYYGVGGWTWTWQVCDA
jgi:hypothetical protein